MTVTAVPDGVRALLTDGGVVRVRMLAPSDVVDVLELHLRLDAPALLFAARPG